MWTVPVVVGNLMQMVSVVAGKLFDIPDVDSISVIGKVATDV